MKPNAICFTISLLLFGSLLSAQAPGYLGRKNTVRMDLNFLPRLNSNQWPNNYGGTQGFNFNRTAGIGYERVVSRRHVLGLDLDYTPTGRANISFLQQNGRIATRTFGLGIHLKAFPFLLKGWMAPVGPYVTIAFKMIHVNGTFVPSSVPTNRRTFERHIGASTAVTFGYSAMIGGRILADFGLRFALTDFINALGASGIDASYDAYQILGTDLMKAHVGIGYLF